MGWLFNKILRWDIQQQRKEMTSFLDSLRGMDDDELSSMVLVAADIRNGYSERLASMPLVACYGLQDPFTLVDAVPDMAIRIKKNIKQLQAAGNPVVAAGLMVWLHTVRGAITPELRHLARGIWGELERGMDEESIAAAHAFFLARGIVLDTTGYDAFPVGFEPR